MSNPKPFIRPSPKHLNLLASRRTDTVFDCKIPIPLFQKIVKHQVSHIILYFMGEYKVGDVLALNEYDFAEAWLNHAGELRVNHLEESVPTGSVIYVEITHIDWLGYYMSAIPIDKWGIASFHHIKKELGNNYDADDNRITKTSDSQSDIPSTDNQFSKSDLLQPKQTNTSATPKTTKGDIGGQLQLGL